MNNVNLVSSVTTAIKENNQDIALDHFKELLNSVPDGSTYRDWTNSWCVAVEELGESFSDKDPQIFLIALRECGEEHQLRKEVVDFIYSEIIFNFFCDDITFVKDELKAIKKKYPANPEFHHSYSHILYLNGNYTKSLEVLEQAIKINPCERFVKTYINRVRSTYNYLIQKGRVKSAGAILTRCNKTFDSMKNKEHYFVYTNALAHLVDRQRDHETIETKIGKIDGIISKKTEVLRNRFVSMLGVFAAVIAFILTSVNLAISNLNTKEIMLLMLSMADVLIIFTISIDYVFRVRQKSGLFSFLEDKQFWAIICLLGILYYLYTKV